MNSAEREKLNRDGPSLQKMIGKLSRQKIPVFFVALVLIFIFSKVGGDSGPKTYGIMFDAGSTGSRIHVYRFHKDSSGNLQLEDELFEQVKPGLSSYPDNVEGARESIANLIQKAKDYIPEDQWDNTPVALKASAGLRILGEEKSTPILKGVGQLLKDEPFNQKWDAEIMGGDKEAVYSWVTLNYLAGAFSKNDGKTYGTLDLGGGSTQIAFKPTSGDTRNDWIMKEKVFGAEHSVYIHSYLGLGLMSARELVLGGPHEDSESEVTSPCFAQGFTTAWENARSSYKISGSGLDFEACRTLADQAINSKQVDSPAEIKNKPFYAFSYYFDRAEEVGLISEKGGQLKVNDFTEAAKAACKPGSRRDSENADWLCIDLTIISSLLENGFGFDGNNDLYLYKKINGIETQWSLGATFALFSE